MSGDVQPRKRREKKKKKEDGPEDVVFQHQHQPATSPIVTDDLNIHIQKEASTGGGLCAKFVFFILLTVLTTLIGLIITEHRGLTDLNTIDTESRFAQLFEGWIDAPALDHESGEELSLEQSEEHAYEEEEEENHDEEEDEDDDEHDQSVDHDEEEEEEEEDEDEDEDEEVSEEQATDEENYEEEKEESEIQDDTIETESEEVSNENDDEVDDEQEEDENEEEEQEYASEDEEISDGERDASSILTKEENTQEDEEDSKEDIDKEEDSEEAVDKTAETEESTYAAESEEAADLTESEEAVEETADQTESEDADDQAESEETASLGDTEESTKQADKDDTAEIIDTSATTETRANLKETIRKVRSENRVEPKKKKATEDSEDANQPQEMDNYNMAIKFGVGTALLVVAHVVLVQKWRTGEKISTKKTQQSPEETETVTPDLSRRNTIVTPPSLQEIEQDIENVEEEYSEDDEDYDSDDDSRSKPTRAKMRYQELQSTYSHTLSPDWEPKEVRETRNKNSDEEEEELEGDEEYDDEISENEDEELLKRLEAKYGRIRHSDEEPDDDADDDNDDEEEYEEEGELEEDRDDDFDSWKRVKVPSDNAPEDSDSENEKEWSKQRSGAQAIYDFENITNSDDWQVREELDRAQQNLANDAAYALTLFNKILERNPSSPRALYGRAQSLDILAEEKKSNNLLQQAIASYQQVLQITEVPTALFQLAAERCIDRMRFRGHYSQAVPIHKLLIEKFPEEVKFPNHLAVTYLTTNNINEARKLLHETLLKWPNDGFALVHYGFILKTNDNNLEQAVEFLQKGIKTKEPGVVDGRFYFHLGDALTRLGRNEEAMNVYSDGVANKVFLSKYQRSLYNVERLTGKPWWEKEETPYVRFFEQLEKDWKIIRNEGLSILNKKGYFQPEAENLRDIGDWKQFELFARGIKNSKNCKQCPITCKIVETIPDAIGCRRGQIKFSVMHPGTHVWPHCGPTNCRLRSHLGLKVPSSTYIRVGEEIRSWEEGKLLIFDDSFEHEVWHNGTATRLVLIIDIWHPELTKREKQSLSSI